MTTAQASPAASAGQAQARPDLERLLLEERLTIQLVLDGQVHAFRKLVDRYQRPVRGVIFRMIGRREEADDLAQQAFLQAFHALGDFQLELRFSSWLYRIAVNVAKDFLKSRKRTEVGLGDETSADDAMFAGQIADPEHETLSAERRALLHRALARVPVKYREVLVLKDIEELSYQEIQRVLELPLTTLKIRVVRAREMLRQVLEGES